MSRRTRTLTTRATILALGVLTAAPVAAALAPVAGADVPGRPGGPEGPGGPGRPGGPWRGVSTVYVQTNDAAGNQVVSYLPDRTGALHEVDRVATGGIGTTLQGAQVDALASQGGLVADPATGTVVAVNAGSDTVTVFRSFGPELLRRAVLPSGGPTPVSVAVRGDLLYVLDAGGAGTVQGYDLHTLRPIPGATASLGLTPGAVPQFLNSPGQIGFTPSGRQLVVTTKANGSHIDVLNLTWWGGLAGPVVQNPSATPVPFGFTFDAAGRLVVTEAATSATTTYTVAPNGTTTELGSTSDGLAALCWITADGPWFFGANAGSASVTTETIGASGTPAVVATAATDPGPIDLVASRDGRFLYVETGGSDLVDSFFVAPDGTLAQTGSVAPEAPGHTGLEGIAVG